MRGIRLGSVLGFEIRIDYSWFVIAFLILWSFSAGVFPERFPGLTPLAYLAMGIVGAVLFFVSLLAHELSHSLVARARGIPVDAITLFVFGGVAHIRKEAETPEDELVIAGVGPLCSTMIAVLFTGVWWLGLRLGWPVAVTGVAQYLGMLNLILALFNLLPGFPLDGGRLFRALVWRFTGSLTKATRWASNGGKTLGYVLMGLGALEVMAGLVVGGLWLVFIGWFLRTAAEVSYEQHMLGGLLSSTVAGDLMTADPSTASPGTSITELVERLLREPHQAYPVLTEGSVVGLVSLDQVKRTPRSEWSVTRVADVMEGPKELVVPVHAPVSDVLATMRASRSNRVMVVDDHSGLVGIISGSDVARWIQKQRMLAELTGVPPAHSATKETAR